MVLESNITEIQINMKEDGKLAWEMDKEHIGYLKAKINWEENTPGIGKMKKKLVEALCSIKMGIVMMVYGKIFYYITRLDDKSHGEGRIIYANGDVYEGMWFMGNRSGYGVLTKRSGDHFEGHWVNDKREGQGSYFYAQKN